MSQNYSVENEAKHIILNILEVVKKSQYLKVGEQPIHSGILGFMTLLQIENENIFVFQKSKWIIKQKLIRSIGFFSDFFSQLILTTGSQNTGPDIAVYYEIWARVSTKRAGALFSNVVHTSRISHFKAESIGYLNHLAQKSLYKISQKMSLNICHVILTREIHVKIF